MSSGATIIEPLRVDWQFVVATADNLRQQAQELAKLDRRAADELFISARQVVRDFHEKLCLTRVLDPACGTGNFLYVALEQMKRLEGEVIELLETLGGQESIEWLDKHNVDPHQFLGLEINPRAAAIAELVLWIGYLQWHFRTKGTAPEEPILRAFKNIQEKNAVLTWDGEPIPKNVDGKEAYPNARLPDWPAAEFIVGNPPFIGASYLRSRLGDAFVETLWQVHSNMNESADFVMYWWDRAADLLTRKGTVLRRFGLITTNSISQVLQRKVIERHFKGKKPISLVMAIPDHPWTKATQDAAAVRIAMTVAESGNAEGVLREVTQEGDLETDSPRIFLKETMGLIHADLTVGADVGSTVALQSNHSICHDGVKLHGRGFIITPEEAAHLGLGKRIGLNEYIRNYRNGRDLAHRPRGVMVIDLFGLSSDSVRDRFPEIYQHLSTTVKPERERVAATSSSNDVKAYAREWWLFGKPRPEFRFAATGLARFIATVDTARHRVFQFLTAQIICDDKSVLVASDDAFILGTLSARTHLVYSLRAGGWLGVGNDSVYTKTKTFDPFPFPDANNIQKQIIRGIAEKLDAHRKRVLAEHAHLTLTGLYNVLEKLRAGTKPDELDEHERTIFDDGLVLIMTELHDNLDIAVAEAYGWPVDLSDDEILAKLVALNKERSAEEKRGLVRWLRPDYQIPRFAKGVDKQAAKEEGAQVAAELIAAVEQKPSFPAGAVEQTAAVFAALAAASEPLDAKGLAAQFRRTKTTEKKVGEVLASLARLGYVTSEDGKTFALRRAA